MKKHIIIAPHADDEIIGCFQILESGGVDKVYFATPEAKEEAQISQHVFKFGSFTFSPSNFEVLMDHCQFCDNKGGLIFFPDPSFELHPEHRMIGGFGEILLKRILFTNVVFYSTNMNAPYIEEVRAPYSDKKRISLDNCYGAKKSLWEFDHKYFLFEGYTRWGVPSV